MKSSNYSFCHIRS